MNDMSPAIVPRSDQWNADDFIAGPITFTIAEVCIRGGQEQPVNIRLQGSDKTYRPCKSMCRALVYLWGADAAKYIGRSLTLYRDEKVKWGGLEVGGIRISHASHIDQKMVMQLTVTRGSRRPHVVLPLVAESKPSETGHAMKASELDTLPQKRKDTIAAFGRMGVGPDKVLLALGLVRETDISLDHIATLRGMWSSLKSGEVGAEEMFAYQAVQIEDKPAGDRPKTLDDIAQYEEGK
jgi:hypothetical protein